MTTPAAAAASSHISMTLDKHLTTLVNCLQNVVYVVMLFHFIDTFVSWVCFVATNVSPVESWKGLFYNIWFSVLVFSTMLTFKGTLEAMILFENAKRHRDGKKDSTTIIAVDENSAQIKHVDNGLSSSAWQTVASYILLQFLNKAQKNEDNTKSQEQQTSTPEATTPVSSTEDEIKNDDTSTDDGIKHEAATTDDEIKQDAASASSSARSSADTADALN
jgi:hypothetical protein